MRHLVMDQLTLRLLALVCRKSRSALLFLLPALSGLEYFQSPTNEGTESLESRLTCDDVVQL